MSEPSEQRSKIVADLEKDQVSQLVHYMTGLSSGQFVQHGKNIDAFGLPRKKLKFLLHKFLHTQHLTDYGVLDTSGIFEIIHITPEKKKPVKHENLKASMPFDPYTANAHGRPLYAPWMKPSGLVEWQGKPPLDKKKRSDY